jgi:ribosome-binding ATPase
MYISIIGAAGSGKTMLFQALSGIKKDDGIAPNTIVTVDVPDERLEMLSKIFNPKKTVHARIEISDTATIEEGDVKNETISPKAIQKMRTSDAFILILRQFDNGLPVDPVSEFMTIFTEFILSDMAQIEMRLERINKQGGKKDNPLVQQEKAMLEKCLAHLNEEKPLSVLQTLNGEGKMLRGFQFLSQKPMMLVVNCDEMTVDKAETILSDIKLLLPGDIPIIVACAKLEAELALMPPEECADFMLEYGIKETIRDRIIQLACRTLGLIFFLTVGEDECRAWPIKRGMSAQDAAGTIHTDFYNKFIRAETVGYNDFIKYGNFAECKKAGVWRLEGKEYVVKDGDIISIRAGN